MKGGFERIRKEVSIPDSFQNLDKWSLKRRQFLRAAAVSGALSQISLLEACTNDTEEGNEILTSKQVGILKNILLILFPNDGNGPGAEEINAYEYIMWVLRDTLNRKPEDNEYIIEGIDWANESANEIYGSDYLNLNQEDQETLVELFTKMDWGKNWCSAVIVLILESLLLDPIYGGNPDEIGWKWLNHTAGVPRPTEANRYERIMERQMKKKL